MLQLTGIPLGTGRGTSTKAATHSYGFMSNWVARKGLSEEDYLINCGLSKRGELGNRKEAVAMTQGDAASATGPSVLDSIPHCQSRVAPAFPKYVSEVTSHIHSFSIFRMAEWPRFKNPPEGLLLGHTPQPATTHTGKSYCSSLFYLNPSSYSCTTIYAWNCP